MEIESIKIIAAICAVLGSSILAFRVTGILKALALVGQAHEINIHQLMNDDGVSKIVHMANTTDHVDRANKAGLLIVGFLLTIASGLLQVAALFMSNELI